MDVRALVGPKPSCFTPSQWDEWLTWAELVTPTARNGYCEDCLPSFKLAQSQNCDHPETKFTLRGPNAITGRRPRTQGTPT
jgi:hypothetical protein